MIHLTNEHLYSIMNCFKIIFIELKINVERRTSGKWYVYKHIIN